MDARPAATAKPEPADRESQLFADSLLREATLQMERQEYEAAERSLAKALAIVPRHPGCLACLAVCLAEGQHKFITAERLARLAVRLMPRNASCHFSLGRVYQLGSRHADAKRHLRKALRLAPRDARIRHCLEETEKLSRPLLPLVGKDHPLNVGLVHVGEFLARDRHLVLILCMMISLTVWLGLSLYGHTVAEREAQVLAWESRPVSRLNPLPADKGRQEAVRAGIRIAL